MESMRDRFKRLLGRVPHVGFLGLILVAQASVPARAQHYVYVTNFRSNTASVIDAATSPPAVVTTLIVGTGPTGVAGTP